MKGFVWGFPTSNKFWKNSWFFVGKRWGQSINFNLDGTRMTCRVPRYFCSPQWNHGTSAFTDEELKTLARRAAVRPLGKRGKPYLYNEGKMITARLFPQISARRKRRKLRCIFLFSYSFICSCISLLTRIPFFFLFGVYDVDVVCDALARRMKGIVEASRKEALRQQDAGVAPPR